MPPKKAKMRAELIFLTIGELRDDPIFDKAYKEGLRSSDLTAFLLDWITSLANLDILTQKEAELLSREVKAGNCVAAAKRCIDLHPTCPEFLGCICGMLVARAQFEKLSKVLTHFLKVNPGKLFEG